MTEDRPTSPTDDRSTTMDHDTGSTQDQAPETSTPPLAPRRRARPASTVFGLLFLAVAGAWAAHEQDLLDGDELGRAMAVGLIVLGALGLLASVLLTRRGRAVGS